MKAVWVDGQKITFKAADMIQSGGEGMIFTWQNDQVIKLYHAANSQHQAKLQAMIDGRLADTLPNNVYAPQKLVYDKNGNITGFVMAQLPAGYQPFKRLSNANYTKKQGVDLAEAAAYLQSVQQMIASLHQQGIVIGDLNDQNIFFAPNQAGAVVLVDVDSVQIGTFPCPVAMQPFLDPTLYTVPDFSLKPYFSPASDWYAFAVLMVRTLLFVHPYGGVHPTFKSLAQRAENRASILSPQVKHPPKARPLSALSPQLHNFAGRVFEQGERPLVTSDLLDGYARYLQNPQAQQKATTVNKTVIPTKANKLLLETTGHLTAVWPQPHGSRYYALVHEDGVYRLIYAGVGGLINDQPLFKGSADYRFGLFGRYLLVNPPNRRQLLVLDIEAGQPERVAMLETEIFRDGAEETAVFATTPNNYYRLANGYVMQGEITGNSAVDGVHGTAYQNQTQLWGSPHNDSILALHRSFGAYTLFARLSSGQTVEQEIPLPAKGSVKQATAAFSPDHASLLLQIVENGREQTMLCPVGETAVILPFTSDSHAHLPSGYYFPTDQGVLKWKNNLQTVLSNTADLVTSNDILHPHPHGLLAQKGQRLLLTEI